MAPGGLTFRCTCSGGSWLSSYSAATPANNLHVEDLTAVNFRVAYKLHPWMRLTGDVTNVFNEPPTLYRGYTEPVQSVIKSGTLVVFGVAGRF